MSEPGSHGINIQDSSTVVSQDHDIILRTVTEVTQHINSGLVRSFRLRRGGPAAEADPAAAPTPMRSTPGEQLRNATLIEETTRAPKSVNDLSRSIGDLMFRLFMPEQMQRYIAEMNCSITITTNDLEVPWELMWCSDDFLCLKWPVARADGPRLSAASSRRSAPTSCASC